MATKILIIEDDGIFASLLRMKLENWGYEVPKIVLTGHEAIKHMKDIDPDLIIINRFLKGKLNSIETAKMIDAEFKTPIIYCSAKNDEKLSKKVKALENRDYIPKTCKDEHLKLIIENNLKSDSKINKIKSTSNDEKSLLIKNPRNDIKVTHDYQNTVKITHKDENNEIKSGKEENTSKVKNPKNPSHNKTKSVAGNLKPEKKENTSKVKNPKKDYLDRNYTTLSDNVNKAEITLSKEGSGEYHRTQKKIEHELQNLETYFFKVSNKAASQEIKIMKLKEAEEKYINSMREKDEKIEELEKHNQKLEEKLSIHKKQRETILNEMYSLKKQIDALISILES